eukprot:757778-Hanusia_phi.AAC.1
MNRAIRLTNSLKSLRALSRSFSQQALRLDSILGADLSFGPLAQKTSTPVMYAMHGNENESEEHYMVDSQLLQSEALEKAQLKDRAYVLSLAESLFSQAGANWNLEFTTAKYEQLQSVRPTESNKESEHHPTLCNSKLPELLNLAAITATPFSTVLQISSLSWTDSGMLQSLPEYKGEQGVRCRLHYIWTT